MRIVRYQSEAGGPAAWGWLSENKVGVLEGTPFAPFRRTEAVIPIEQVQILPPVEPGKIICVGRNYAAHAKEHDAEIPKWPLLFLKAPSSVIGPNETIYLPPQSKQVEHEAELAVVIKQSGRWLAPEEAPEYILGYTAANDVTARDLQRIDGQWTRAKGFDTFCPLGPWIETDLDTADTMIMCKVNGQMRQMASTKDMIFPVDRLIAFISSIMTLKPGDLILTGTPSGVSPLSDGDEVAVEIEGIGTLTNPVEKEPSRS